ncbi:hypothetical protein HanPI659440_Chr05g0204481 [Helianthus annuus]|nr:hypothetical protein HanPI659440_Chr05g0204481 [Helianthus annuus]
MWVFFLKSEPILGIYVYTLSILWLGVNQMQQAYITGTHEFL